MISLLLSGLTSDLVWLVGDLDILATTSFRLLGRSDKKEIAFSDSCEDRIEIIERDLRPPKSA